LGLDAVEVDQQCRRAGVEWACGRDARSFLAGLLKATETSCASDGRDQYRRVLARCRVNDRDLGDAIVRAGWATADIEYALALAEARLQGRGIWSGDFDDPADWRRRHGDSGPGIWEWLRGLFG
jgi:endonuclease YncB( thermonuclease family)